MDRFRGPRAANVVLIATLLIALPVLALLQYRWLGQVSDAERERLQASWRTGVAHLAQDVDRELSRAFLHFQRHGSLGLEGEGTPYAARLREWRRVSPYPRLVARGWLLRAGDGGVDPGDRRVDPVVEAFTDEGTLVAAPWPAILDPWRDAFREDLQQAGIDTGPGPGRLPLILDDVPAIVVSLTEIGLRDGLLQPPRLTGFVVLEIDAGYLSRELLPLLTTRYFGEADTYQLGVVDARGGRVLFRTSEHVTAATLAQPDASAPILRVRFADFGELLHGSDAEAAPGARPRRNVAVGVFRREAGPEGTGPRTTTERVIIRAGAGNATWTVAVTHAAGSLDAAVASNRRRNLAVSFGVLLVLGAAVSALAVSSRRAQRLVRQQMDFVAGVSHELRTPLAVIRSAGENLADGVVDDPAQVRTYGALVATEGRRLTEMVDQVLEFAGGPGRRPAEPRPVDVAALIDDVARTWGEPAAREGFAFAAHADPRLPPVLGDAAALQRAVGNLVSNAIKYSVDQREVDVTATTADRSQVVVAVADRGLGVPDEERAHVFEPFYRGRQAIARQIHGNGLGLSLVKATVDSHGGRVEVAARPGGGTVVRLVLPAQPVES